jgi:hypothetical protein
LPRGFHSATQNESAGVPSALLGGIVMSWRGGRQRRRSSGGRFVLKTVVVE